MLKEKKKKTATKNTLLGKVVLQKKEFSKQAKSEGSSPLDQPYMKC